MHACANNEGKGAQHSKTQLHVSHITLEVACTKHVIKTSSLQKNINKMEIQDCVGTLI